jgi:hypothetical protein
MLGKGLDECKLDFAVCDSGGGIVGRRREGVILRHGGIFVICYLSKGGRLTSIVGLGRPSQEAKFEPINFYFL